MTNFKSFASLVFAATIVPALPAETHCPGNVASLPFRLARFPLERRRSHHRLKHSHFKPDRSQPYRSEYITDQGWTVANGVLPQR
jgi:hypothetical protein